MCDRLGTPSRIASAAGTMMYGNFGPAISHICILNMVLDVDIASFPSNRLHLDSRFDLGAPTVSSWRLGLLSSV